VFVAGKGSRPAHPVGSITTYGWVERLSARGKRDAAFHRFTFTDPHGAGIAAMARDHHGRIVLAGERGNHQYTQTAVLRLTASGRRDRHFGDDGLVVKQIGALRAATLVGSRGQAVAIDARDRIVVAGTSYDAGTEDRQDEGRGYVAVARLKG
jgi:hypothetical protein